MKIPVVLFKGDLEWKMMGEFRAEDLKPLFDLLRDVPIMDGEDGPGLIAYAVEFDLQSFIPFAKVHLRELFFKEGG